MDDLPALILLPLEANRAALSQDIRQRFEETRHDLDEYGDELHALKEALQDYPDFTRRTGGWMRQAVAGGCS